MRKLGFESLSRSLLLRPPRKRQCGMSRKLDTRSAVAAALASGASQAEVARSLGVSRSTVAYHAARLGLPSNPRCARRYDWAEIQRYYDAGHSVAGCQERF